MKILDKEITLKYGLRSMFVWEEMMDKPFEINTLMDTYCFFYACIISNPDNPSIEFNDFIGACDENPILIDEFNEFMSQEMKKRDTVSPKKKAGRPRKNSR